MQIDVLEARRLLSTAVVSNGVLTITGTDANNYIILSHNGATNRTSVRDNFSPSPDLGSFNPTTFQRVSVRLLNGNDYFTVTHTTTKPMTIDGGAGNDNVSS